MKTLTILAILIFTILVGYDIFFLHPHHPYFKWQEWSGFYAFLGLFASISLMFFAKLLGRLFLYKNENYYKDH